VVEGPHERPRVGRGKIPNNKNMDLHNNAVGRALFHQHKGDSSFEWLGRLMKDKGTFVDAEKIKDPDKVKALIDKAKGLVFILK
jgi:hypothetical protein